MDSAGDLLIPPILAVWPDLGSLLLSHMPLEFCVHWSLEILQRRLSTATGVGWAGEGRLCSYEVYILNFQKFCPKGFLTFIYLFLYVV